MQIQTLSTSHAGQGAFAVLLARLQWCNMASAMAAGQRRQAWRALCSVLQPCPPRVWGRGLASDVGPKLARAAEPVQDLKLEHFIGAARAGVAVEEVASKSAAPLAPSDMSMPSSSGGHLVSEPKSVYLETYGCQMNVSDSEIVLAVLQSAGYERCEEAESADVILTNTCAIRENAEAKIWQRLGAFKNMKARRKKGERPVVGVLGCMAERLKTQLLESDKSVDLVVGPDAYRDLPNLITLVTGGASQEDVEDAVHAGSKRRVSRGAVPAGGGLAAINVQLSADETYADIAPVRADANSTHAFVSIMRGCNNMCTYCIVPFTRGRERSRDVSSICREVAQLGEQGYKEVVLLGQNVNSYRDASTPSDAAISGPYAKGGDTDTASGFSNLYNARGGGGVRFTELLERVTRENPEMRVRFTSPHPKDFPDELLQLMNERPNLCKQVHLPAQSGSTSVLRSMRRLYTREAYLELAHRIRETVPGVALSSDFIAGFCGESEADHEDTLSLLEQVGYEQGFLFAYSLRERTHAAHKLEDDVPQDTKLRRLREIIDVFNVRARQRHVAEVGKRVVVLVEGPSKRSTAAAPTWTGRADNNMRVVLADVPLLDAPHLLRGPATQPAGNLPTHLGDTALSWGSAPATQRATLAPHTSALRPDGTAEDVWGEFDFARARALPGALREGAAATLSEGGHGGVHRILTQGAAAGAGVTELKQGMYVVADVVAAGGKSLYAVPITTTTLAAAAAHGLL